MLFRGVQNQEQIFAKWKNLINAKNDIKDDVLKMSTAIVLENAQALVDHEAKTRGGRSLIFEAAGIDNGGTFGPGTAATSYANTARDGSGVGDARVPSIVIPMIRRIYPQLIAHKLVGVQPMQGPIGMAFAFRAKYGRFGRGANSEGDEIGYNNVNAAFSGKPQLANKFNNVTYTSGNADNYENIDGFVEGSARIDMPTDGFKAEAQDQGAVSLIQVTEKNYEVLGLDESYIGKQVQVLGEKGVNPDPQVPAASGITSGDNYMDYFLGEQGVSQYGGRNYGMIGDGADTSDAENWAVGRDMPEAGFEILKATVTAKTRKLGVQITRETEEDMKAMQGLNAQQEISDLLSYEISQEMDRQLLGEIIQAAVRAGNASVWDPAKADGRNQNERVNTLYTTILDRSAKIAVKSRRGAANWCVASPGAAALLESNIVNPLGVGGGLGNANAFGKEIDNGIGVTEIGALRNGTITLYRDTLAGGDYILLGFKGNNIYDAGIIYLPYIPLELMQAQDPFTFNPITAARTRYGVTTNLFGAGQFYQFIGLKGMAADLPACSAGGRVFVQ